jgi:pseudaminic acid synthase
MNIARKTIRVKKPIIIAEISGNHKGNKNRFLKLIKSAIFSGADLVKIQTYEPKDITLNKKSHHFKIKKGIWKNQTLWNLYQKAHTPFAWHKAAFKIARKHKGKIFSSPFSIRSVDLLEKLKCPIYKIASFEITDYKLIDYIASKKKPIILSTGMSTITDVKNAVRIINKYHNKVSILHCVSNYPTKIFDSDLSRIQYLKKKFPKNKIGLSDHTNGISSSILASQMGVEYIEKHYNMDNVKTADSSFSISPFQLNELKEAINYLFNKKRNVKNIQIKNLFLRRSIYATKIIKKNEKITYKNIDTFRPKIGICASRYFKILNKKAKKQIFIGQPIFEKMLF